MWVKRSAACAFVTSSAERFIWRLVSGFLTYHRITLMHCRSLPALEPLVWVRSAYLQPIIKLCYAPPGQAPVETIVPHSSLFGWGMHASWTGFPAPSVQPHLCNKYDFATHLQISKASFSSESGFTSLKVSRLLFTFPISNLLYRNGFSFSHYTNCCAWLTHPTDFEGSKAVIRVVRYVIPFSTLVLMKIFKVQSTSIRRSAATTSSQPCSKYQKNSDTPQCPEQIRHPFYPWAFWNLEWSGNAGTLVWEPNRMLDKACPH